MSNVPDVFRSAVDAYLSGQAEQAQRLCQTVLDSNPRHADGLNLLGLVLCGRGRRADATAYFGQAIEADGTRSEFLVNLGEAYRGLGQVAEAKECFARAVEVRPGDLRARYLMATTLLAEGRVPCAEACFEQLFGVVVDDAESLSYLAWMRVKRCEWGAAKVICDRLLQQDAGDVDAHFFAGMARLAEGDFAGGWPEFEWRLKTAQGQAFPEANWDGAELAGRRIWIYAEWGLGDAMQFIRYLPLVQQRGGNVVLQLPPALIPLFKQAGFDQLIPCGAPAPDCEFRAPLMSLPRIFGTTLASIPADIPYLSADPDLVAGWRRRLAAYPGFKIGIHWHGEPSYLIFDRSIPLSAFAPIASLPGTTLFSLQKKTGLDELISGHDQFEVVDFGNELDETHGAFMDSAAIMKNLDLVITCDTSTAHLAGALGVPVWVGLLRSAEWRWLQARDDSPWYPTMRLFRQTTVGDWSEPMARMAGALAGILAERHTPQCDEYGCRS